MEIKEIKACPLLGCHEQENTVFEKALGIASTEIVLEAYECMGEKCREDFVRSEATMEYEVRNRKGGDRE